MKKAAVGGLPILTGAYIIFAVVLLSSLGGCAHEHRWKEADCTTPRTCSVCGETEGEALGHNWREADCEHPSTCSRCGETKGEPLGHEWGEEDDRGVKICLRCGKDECEALGHEVENWKMTLDSTCTEPGSESGVCTRCGETVEREIELKEHTPSDWIILEPATLESGGKRVIQCRVCGKELESEHYELTEEEYEKEYKRQCAAITYNDLQRYPEKYKGTKIKLTCIVFQIVDEASSKYSKSEYLVKAGGNYYYLKIDNYGAEARILENDRLNVWGEVDDLYTYYTLIGTNTVPQINVKYYE